MQENYKKRNFISRKQLLLFLFGMLCIIIATARPPNVSFAEGTLTDNISPVLGTPLSSSDNYAVPNGFSTHMPILVMELHNGAEERNDYYMDGTISAYVGNAFNSLGDEPSFLQQASIRNMTRKANNTTQKCDYYLNFAEDNGLLGLGQTSEYMLLGSRNDKSLIRNYLGYQIAAMIMEDAPSVQLCELIFRTAEGDLYQGVYLLVEKNTPDTSVLFYHGTMENGIEIETYSTINNVAPGKMYIPFMESTQWNDRYGDIIGSVSTAEGALYSSNSSVFYTHADLFDVPAFINRFILGELMQDYAGISNDYFYYDTDTKRMSPAPIWNFELALDNEAYNYADVADLQYDEAVYFQQLFQSHQFATQVQSTYLTYRRDALDEKTLIRLVDEAADYVAPAVDRDWNRWSAYSHQSLASVAEVDESSESRTEAVFFSRQTPTFDEEILRIKYQLREHSLHMAYSLTMFDFSEKEISKEIVLNANPVWIFLFLFVFFSLVRFARRYGV